MWNTVFGVTKEGKKAHRYILVNNKGMRVELSDFGALVLSIYVLDKYGRKRDVVLGYDNLMDYYEQNTGFGAYIGRNANRIAGAEVTIEDIKYLLDKNDNQNNLHSGFNRSHHKLYSVRNGKTDACEFVEMERYSPNMEQGFPGNLEQKIRYTLTDKNEFIIDYEMLSDMTTVVNPTNHSYFNLDGHNSGSVLQHTLTLEADYFTPGDAQSIPTGEILPVENTPMDFREGRKIGERIEEEYEPLRFGNGYDHNWVLKNKGNFEKVAELMAEESGIVMETYTDRPGMQIYTANFVENEVGKEGVVYGKRSAVCLETQCYPDAVHHENFPSPVYRAGEKYTAHTAFRFLIKK